MNGVLACDTILLVQADFDGELDAVQAAEVEHHRAGCAACQAAYASLQQVRARLRESDLYAPAPESLRTSVAARIAAPAPIVPRARANPWMQRAMGFGVGAVMAATLALSIVTPGRNPILDEVVAGHVRALQPGHLEDVVSTDQHTVKPWFDGKLDFAPPVKDLKGEGFPLEGGRLDYLDNRPVAAMVYGRDKHLINMFVWPTDGADSTPQTAIRNGYNVVHFVHGRMNLWIVSDVEKSQLADFARLWRAAP